MSENNDAGPVTMRAMQTRLHKALERMNGIIAIDFDGTLFEDDYPNIGAPIWGIIARAKQEQANGAKLILWTLREKELLADAIMACALVGLYFDAINANLPDEVEKWKHDPRKVAADEYWDDRGVSVFHCQDCKHSFAPDGAQQRYFCTNKDAPSYGRIVSDDDYCAHLERE